MELGTELDIETSPTSSSASSLPQTPLHMPIVHLRVGHDRRQPLPSYPTHPFPPSHALPAAALAVVGLQHLCRLRGLCPRHARHHEHGPLTPAQCCQYLRAPALLIGSSTSASNSASMPVQTAARTPSTLHIHCPQSQ
ncbi:hypothetical protein EVG20_g5442 [Dentipellis fragilis]|uniref:Uncharacterized protein n=1 Tax=Dentipellis fragilis TaxID=205917 RepID=A0A4Y9YX14_9AGAM|nr:hypothetical protein EVG20_g5442 [Dentipellis fragilis]